MTDLLDKRIRDLFDVPLRDVLHALSSARKAPDTGTLAPGC